MRDGLARLARVGPGEGRLAAALFAVMLLSAAGSGAGATAADALLLARFGTSSLPELYLALGVVSFACALGVSVVFGAVRRERVYPVALVALTGALVGLRIVVTTGVDLAYPVMWLGANVVVMLQGIVAWGVASWLCDARQAKRLFPLANAAKIAGAVAGGAAVAPLVLVLHLEDLLVLWALCLLATLGVVLRLVQRAPAAPLVRRAMSLREELFSGFRIVRGSPLLRLLALALVLFSVLFFSLALPFTRAARTAMPREDELASYLGIFNATTTAAAFVASLVLANRFYARFGVVNAILVLTLIYLSGFIAVAVSDSFIVVAAARWLQLAWLAGMADAAYQGLFNPVPAERRDQMRAFMEGVPGQAGIALAGLLLIVGDRAVDSRVVAVGGAIAAAVTTGVIWRARGAYRDALVDALRAGRPEPFLGGEESYAATLRDRAAFGVVRDGLRSGEVLTRRASAQMLGDFAPADARDVLLEAARDPDAAVRSYALAGGARADPRAFAEVARASLDDVDTALRTNALGVLALAGDDGAASALRDQLSAPDPLVRLAAVRAAAALPDMTDRLVGAAGDGDRAVRRAALAALAGRDRTRALGIATADLAERPDDALAALEELPEARAAPALRAFATAQRERAGRWVALLGGIAGDGALASLLRTSLERRRDAAAGRAVRAAAILSGRRAPAALLDGLASRDPGRRAEALEGLETFVDPDLARPLLRVWEGPHVTVPAAALADDEDAWIRDCYAALSNGGGDMNTLATIPLMERVLFLHRVPLFAALDPADTQQVARIASERSFAEGEVIARQGDLGDALYVVVSGGVNVEQDGRRVATRGAGDVVGEMSIVSSVPRIATLVAASATRTLRIARADFESILRDRPETALGVIRVLAERLTEATAAR